jgi:hypothetical protein
MPRSTRTCDCCCASSKDNHLAAPADIDDFLARLMGVERAWSLLDKAEHLVGNDLETAQKIIDEAVTQGAASAQVLTKAARLLAADEGGTEAAHALLERAVHLDGAPAPTQLALARSLAKRGNLPEASRWLRGAMLRSRPDGALLLELATMERRAALDIAMAARSLSCRDANLAVSTGCTLIAQGHRKAARIAFDMAFAAGARSADFVTTYSELLADPAMHEDPPLPPGPLGMPHWWNIGTFAAATRLAAAFPQEALLAAARAREASDQWIDRDRIMRFLSERIRAARPFSWIRLGDGEARFMLHLRPKLRASLPGREADAMIRQIWYVWFGQDLDTVSAGALAGLGARLDLAIYNADLLGLTSVERLLNDQVHYGFCASLEYYVAELLQGQSKRLFTDATLVTKLHESDPFLSSLLAGLDFLGVVSPHPDLARRLQRQLGIDQTASYDIPGETRLERPREHADRGTHFPAAYERTLAELRVPHQGAVFLVAGGLLGKIYCDHIKTLGGIALDVGAVVDAWMGHNSRGHPLAASMRMQLPA